MLRSGEIARRTDGCGRSFQALAIVVAAFVGAGEAPVLFHLATVPHVASFADGHMVFVGAEKHASGRELAINYEPPPGEPAFDSPRHAPSGSIAAHRHSLQFWSEWIDDSVPVWLEPRPPTLGLFAAWPGLTSATGPALYRLAPKQSPPA